MVSCGILGDLSIFNKKMWSEIFHAECVNCVLLRLVSKVSLTKTSYDWVWSGSTVLNNVASQFIHRALHISNLLKYIILSTVLKM